MAFKLMALTHGAPGFRRPRLQQRPQTGVGRGESPAQLRTAIANQPRAVDPQVADGRKAFLPGPNQLFRTSNQQAVGFGRPSLFAAQGRTSFLKRG